jgi:hypothetical protein
MEKEKQKNDRPAGPGSEDRDAAPKAQAVGDLCRCKETALMKPRQLFQRMIDDLSFWKKAKKGKQVV